MSAKALHKIGIGGSFVDTLMETWHSAEAIGTTINTSDGNWIETFLNIDERVLVGDLTLFFIVLATWAAIAATYVKRIFPGFELPLLGLGMVGSFINSALITKYALSAFYTHYHGAKSTSALWQAFVETDDAAKLGLIMYAVLFIATWIPVFLLVRKLGPHKRDTSAL